MPRSRPFSRASASAAFAVEDAKEVRQSNIIQELSACADSSTCADVRTNGEYEFLEDGLHVYTDEATGQRRRPYFAPRAGTARPDVAS